MNPFVYPKPEPSEASRIIRKWLVVAGLSLPSGLIAGVFVASMFWGCSFTKRAILPELPEVKITVTKPEPTPAPKPSRR